MYFYKSNSSVSNQSPEINSTFEYNYLNNDRYIRDYIQAVFNAVEQQDAPELVDLLKKEIPISTHYMGDEQTRPIIDFKNALQHALYFAAKKGYEDIVEVIADSKIRINKYAFYSAQKMAGPLDTLLIEGARLVLQNSKNTMGNKLN